MQQTLEFGLVCLLAHATFHLLQAELVRQIEDGLVVTRIITSFIGVFAFGRRVGTFKD